MRRFETRFLIYFIFHVNLICYQCAKTIHELLLWNMTFALNPRIQLEAKKGWLNG